MEMRQLEHLVAVLEVGSIGKAAQQLGLTQPALTQSLRRLEHGLDVALLERSPQGVAPTEAGRALAARARSILLEAQHAHAEVDAVVGRMRGRLAIGCGPSLAVSLVPVAVARVLARYPQIAVTVHEGTSDLMMAELERGTIDLVVGTGPENFAQRGLHADLLMRDAMVIAARPEHPLARQRSVTLSDTLAYPWIVPAVGDFLRGRIEAAFCGAGLSPPVPTVQTNSGSVIRGLLLSGDFLSFLPKRLVKGANQGSALAAVRVSGSGWTRKVHVISRAASVNRPGRLFVSLLRRLCSDEVASDQI